MFTGDNEIATQKTMLRYWHISKREIEGNEYLIAHGIVTGHYRLMDTDYIHTSAIKEININHNTGMAEIQTRNTLYFCPLGYWDFGKQDTWPDVISEIREYETIKEQYRNMIENPTIEAGNVLLVLSNFDEYYFHSLYYVPEGETEPVAYDAYPHIGMFQDSFLIRSPMREKIDIRYYPHYENIEFYSNKTDGCPLFIENIGDITLFARTDCGIMKLNPGERKEVTKENADNDIDIGSLAGGDLYPAGIINL